MTMKSETMDPFGPIEELMGDDGGTLISRTMKMKLIGTHWWEGGIKRGQ